MLMRSYRDFVIDTEEVQGTAHDAKGRPAAFSLRVDNSPVGEADRPEIVKVDDWDYLESCRERLAARTLCRPELDKFGLRLGELILPREIARRMFENSLAWLGEDVRLRLRLRLLPSLSGIPWEYAVVRRMGGEITALDYLVLRPEISLVRHDRIPVPAAPFRAGPKRTALVVMASPKPYDLYPKLNLIEDQRQLKVALSDQPGLEVQWIPDFDVDHDKAGATQEDIEAALRSVPSFDIFHFSGHGAFEQKSASEHRSGQDWGYIVLATEKNAAQEMSADILSSLLAEARVRLAVLSACETAETSWFQRWGGITQDLQKASVPVAVGMQFTVSDRLAREFAREYYAALVAGLTPDEAVSRGRLAMFRNDETARDWGAPVLYMRNDGGQPLPPVEEQEARSQATSAAERMTTLTDVLAGWLRKHTVADPTQIESVSHAGDSLVLQPLDCLLLLRSALAHQQNPNYWMERLKASDQEWLDRPATEGRTKPTEEEKLLGLTAPPEGERPARLEAIARSAVQSSQELERHTAALTLLAVEPEGATRLLRNALSQIGDWRRRSVRRAELFGLLADTGETAARQIGNELDHIQDRLSVRGWRVRRRIARRRDQLRRWSFFGAFGAALALALYRGLLAIPAERDQPGTAFAIASYWGLLFGLALVSAALLSGSLALDNLFHPRTTRPRRADGWTVGLGALGFGVANVLTHWLNSNHLSLSVMPAAMLAGLGPALALKGQPYAGARLGVSGWLKRMAVAALFPALSQLPALCEAVLVHTQQWVGLAIVWDSERIKQNFDGLDGLGKIFAHCAPHELGTCCFACGPASDILVNCPKQLLSVLDAGINGILLAAGAILGMHVLSKWMNRLWPE